MMAHAGQIIKANINHSARAQDLLLQTMAELGLGLAVVAEPFRILVNNVGDETGTLMLLRAGSAEGYVGAAWGKMTVVGLYPSPNAPVSSLQILLDRIRNYVVSLKNQDVLVICDFNAKSTRWGSPRTNPRGEVVVEWAAELYLRLLNEGSKGTCVRLQGESIVDLTWDSPSAARKVKNFRMEEELVSLSDHRYIIIRLLPGGRVANHYKGERQRGRDRERRQEEPHHPRWAIKIFNPDRLLTAAHAATWAAPSEETESQDAER